MPFQPGNKENLKRRSGDLSFRRPEKVIRHEKQDLMMIRFQKRVKTDNLGEKPAKNR